MGTRGRKRATPVLLGLLCLCGVALVRVQIGSIGRNPPEPHTTALHTTEPRNGAATLDDSDLCRSDPGTMCRLRRALERPERVVRLATFGGSVSFGSMLERKNQTYTVQLAAALRARGWRVQVRNLSVRAAGPAMSALCFSGMLDGFVPDIIVLEFSINGGQFTSEESGYGEAEQLRALFQRLQAEYSAAAIFYVDLFSPRSLRRDGSREIVLRNGARDRSYTACAPGQVWMQESTVVVSMLRIVFDGGEDDGTLESLERHIPRHYFAKDNHHLSPAGHRVVAERLLRVFDSALEDGGECAARAVGVAAEDSARRPPTPTCHLYVHGERALPSTSRRGASTSWKMHKLGLGKHALVPRTYGLLAPKTPRLELALSTKEGPADVLISFMSSSRRLRYGVAAVRVDGGPSVMVNASRCDCFGFHSAKLETVATGIAAGAHTLRLDVVTPKRADFALTGVYIVPQLQLLE